MSLDAATLYESLYRLASRNVEDKLFGSNAPLAYEAFQHSLAGNIMPIVWFEIPLSGPPRFDLHVAYGNAPLHREAPFATHAADGYGALLNWYASKPREGGGLALAYDAGDGRIDNPAVHVNVNDATTFDAEGFFVHVERPDATMLYDDIVKRLPQGWRVWYLGVHPGRPGAPVRIDCFVNKELKQSYTTEPSKFEEHLHEVGFATAGEQVLRMGAEIAATSFSMELQFDVMSDGMLGSTMGLSASLPLCPASKALTHWKPGGSAVQLMERIEEMGMADSRWRCIADALFTTAVENGNETLALYCVPVFVKLRTREGEPLDAKIYLQAGTRQLSDALNEQEASQ